MRRDDNSIQTLGTTADILNTLSGGVSEPQVVMTKEDDAHRLQIKVPGVDPKSFEVEVNFNRLHVYFPMALASGGTRVAVPRVLFSQPIPYFVEVNAIAAQAADGSLFIRLPFNERANGDSRKISITEK